MDIKGKTVRIGRSDYEAMVADAEKRAPQEACGLIGGTVENGAISIRKVYFLENTDRSAEHFSLDPKEQLSAIKDMRNNGLSPLGNWHSHPATPARPSEEDIRLAFDKKATYLILSLLGNEPTLNAFHIENGKARKENIEIIE